MKERIHQWMWAVVVGVMVALPQMSGAEVPAAVDTAMRNYMALPDMLLPLLAKIKDYESAEAAAEELQQMLPYVYDSRYELAQIKTLPPEIAAEVRRRYEKEMRTRWGKLFEHIYRLERARCYESPALAKQFSVLCMMLEK